MPRKWTREEEILALRLYCELPFGKVHASNGEVRKLASMLDRTPASVSMKMCNFARFDPVLRSRGVSGLANGSKMDEEIWNEFNGRWSMLVEESVTIMEKVSQSHVDDEEEQESVRLFEIPEGLTRKQVIEVRVNQNFFRKSVLSAYENKCCITGLNVPELLVASHIKPWRDSDPVRERTNPSNGLCLNPLHDKAFDRGMITVTPEFTIVVSSRIREMYSDGIIKQFFESFDGTKISLPSRFAPERTFLEYHNDVVFRR